MIVSPPVYVFCNGANINEITEDASLEKTLILNYEHGKGSDQNIHLELPDFVRSVYNLPDRILDLLEIAAFVFCADRLNIRGSKDAVEFHSWSRTFEFVIKVRDITFWEQSEVKQALSAALEFMTGDREFRFTFLPGHSTPITSLFDNKQFRIEDGNNISVALFSGGLDSLTGVVQLLEKTDDSICLVSHQSQTGTTRTQRQLVEALARKYSGRVSHYKFKCTLRRKRAKEETQRTRSFLYMSIAFAMGQAFSRDEFYVFENGITGMNFGRREDLSNARASRTVHPQTLHHLRKLFELITGNQMVIHTPFLWSTKTEVFQMLLASDNSDLISSSVSCSKTFANLGQASHCGGCSQCIDRRIAAYAAKADDLDDAGIYHRNIIVEPITEAEVKTTAIDYIRQAKDFGDWNFDHFCSQMISELSELVDYLPNVSDEFEAIERVWDLCRRHGQQVFLGMHRMRAIHDDLSKSLESDSLLQLISVREYLRNPVERLMTAIRDIVSTGVPRMFRDYPPKNEADLNSKINALLDTHSMDLRSEHPAPSFACASVVPDHSFEDRDLLIESKYIRTGTSPSKASEGIAADITKYPKDSHILFLVYDPLRAIKDDETFCSDFESTGRCTICIIR